MLTTITVDKRRCKYENPSYNLQCSLPSNELLERYVNVYPFLKFNKRRVKKKEKKKYKKIRTPGYLVSAMYPSIEYLRSTTPNLTFH